MRRLGRFLGHRSAATSWYAGLLRLRHIEVTGLRGILLAEGSVLAGLLLAFAEVSSWWAVVAVPAAVAAMVKLHDSLLGALDAAPDIPDAAAGASPAALGIAGAARTARRGPPRRTGSPAPAPRAQGWGDLHPLPPDGSYPAGIGASAGLPSAPTAQRPVHAPPPRPWRAQRQRPAAAAGHPPARVGAAPHDGAAGGETRGPAVAETADAWTPDRAVVHPGHLPVDDRESSPDPAAPYEDLPPPVDPYAGHPIFDGRPTGRFLTGIPLNPDDADSAGLQYRSRHGVPPADTPFATPQPSAGGPEQRPQERHGCGAPAAPDGGGPAGAAGDPPSRPAHAGLPSRPGTGWQGPSAQARPPSSRAVGAVTRPQGRPVPAEGPPAVESGTWRYGGDPPAPAHDGGLPATGDGGDHAEAIRGGYPPSATGARPPAPADGAGSASATPPPAADGGCSPRHTDSRPGEPRVVGQRPAPPAEQPGLQHWRARQSAAHHYD
ncbi:MAG TPA: hypothetical protein VFY17_07255 [Pilimelia sp.]|nr:hypothetical protein [Pilimelia sp.]